MQIGETSYSPWATFLPLIGYSGSTRRDTREEIPRRDYGQNDTLGFNATGPTPHLCSTQIWGH